MNINNNLFRVAYETTLNVKDPTISLTLQTAISALTNAIIAAKDKDDLNFDINQALLNKLTSSDLLYDENIIEPIKDHQRPHIEYLEPNVTVKLKLSRNYLLYSAKDKRIWITYIQLPNQVITLRERLDTNGNVTHTATAQLPISILSWKVQGDFNEYLNSITVRREINVL